jgi:hypothetical protein
MLSSLCEIVQCSEIFNDVAAIIDDQLREETEYGQQLLSYHPSHLSHERRDVKEEGSSLNENWYKLRDQLYIPSMEDHLEEHSDKLRSYLSSCQYSLVMAEVREEEVEVPKTINCVSSPSLTYRDWRTRGE